MPVIGAVLIDSQAKRDICKLYTESDELVAHKNYTQLDF